MWFSLGSLKPTQPSLKKRNHTLGPVRSCKARIERILCSYRAFPNIGNHCRCFSRPHQTLNRTCRSILNLTLKQGIAIPRKPILTHHFRCCKHTQTHHRRRPKPFGRCRSPPLSRGAIRDAVGIGALLLELFLFVPSLLTQGARSFK